VTQLIIREKPLGRPIGTATIVHTRQTTPALNTPIYYYVYNGRNAATSGGPVGASRPQ